MAEKRETGNGYARRLSRQVERQADRMVRAWRHQASRSDGIGDLNYRALELVHGGLDMAAHSFSRMEKATQPPRRASTKLVTTPRPEPVEPRPRRSGTTAPKRPRTRQQSS